MKVCFFVHECILEAGHTRAMLEVLRATPPGLIQELHLIYYEGASSKELLPEFSGKIIHHRVPLKGIFPFLLKAIFYQIYCFFLIRFILPSDSTKIGIGTACLNVDVVNIQFVQSQWKPLYFKGKNCLSPRNIYKRILFFYFEICETFLYRKSDIRFMSLSQFVTDYMCNKFQIPKEKIKTIYSSANLDHFPSPSLEKKEVLEKLLEKNSLLKDLNLGLPIFLFVGAYERKGLYQALEMLEQKPHSQFIVIGKPESGRKIEFKGTTKMYTIPFTKELKLFYELADVFIFPTIYEPFGLVISEAAAMGNIVIVPKENVGASEILGNLKSVIFIDDKPIDISAFKPLSVSEKVSYSKECRVRLAHYSWKKASEKFIKLITSSL